MNLVLLFDDDFAGDGRARLTGRRARHVREVHRAKAGATLRVGRVNGPVGEGTVLAVGDDEVLLDVRLDAPPPEPPAIDLLLALPRPKVLRRVLQAVTSLGVKRVVLVNAWRVEKSYFDTPNLAPEAIAEELVLGLEQARDTVLPVVEVKRLFKPFVEDELPSTWPDGVRRLVADPRVERALEACDTGASRDRAVVAIGPEGGWIAPELESLARAGFEAFSLGSRILRVETAVPYVLGQLELARRRRD